MKVFSPLVEVQPITPSLDKLWDQHEGAKKDHLRVDKKPSLLFPSSNRRFPLSEEGGGSDHPIFDWKPSSTSKQAREFVNELQASTKASRNPTMWPEASTGASLSANNADTSTVSESSFFAHFMCFEVPALVPPGGVASGNKTGLNNDDTNDDDLGKNSAELAALNESLQELLDGIQLEKEVTPSSKVRADVVRSGFLNTQKGASDGCQDGNKVSGQLHRYEHLSRMAAIDESESLF
ncbi:hypothetical protein TEA_025615 [Camellia sinensis var. sinensis]|uniref:Uncharacterized protein n=1 Tax=Camellia sinensis var. sinensis TaxID=542762 RepID=A0A4S4EKY4_CAMSN|nr:hypothetical protein TEA_025615 [Camellia sinensis var. sinensis]